jgi:SAM-dependent methyltransferase
MLNLDRQNAWREQYRQMGTGWRPATEVYADLVRNQLRPESRVLDIGCGRGGVVEQLDHPRQRTVGIDPDWQSLREHRLAIARVAALGALPFADASFDVAFASWVLEHWAVPARDLAEIGRILAPAGTFVFITPNLRHPLIRLNAVLNRVSNLQKPLVTKLYDRAEDDTFPVYYRANDPQTLHQLATLCGLQLTACHFIEDPTYLAFTPALFRSMAKLEKNIPSASRLHLVGMMQKQKMVQ